MISRDELADIAKLKGLRHVVHAEKDYLLDLFLLAISRETKDELVFKGGTRLYKLSGLDRFSEDLDFSAVRPIETDALVRRVLGRLKDFGVECSLSKKKEPFNSVLLSFRAKGPLYDGSPTSLCQIRVDISLASSVEIPPKPERFSSLYAEVPAFILLAMDQTEVLAEKMRAILTRNKARDAYDAWFLLHRGVKMDMRLVAKKLAYYGLAWDGAQFAERLEAKRRIWQSELRHLLLNPPPSFDEVKAGILKSVTG